ncbi:MAG: metal-dependent hydrolase [Candidatus Tectomicrobia bacterium]|nr:metal-dependent hydrolase [Candidatus Tectomicrobia bacterium]
MADFKTHLSVAGALSGTAAIGCLYTGLTEPTETLLLFTMGTVGGILPDIDSDHSIPAGLLFSCLATLAAFLGVFSRISTYSLAEAICLWVAVFVFVRYLVFELFKRFTVHRGVFHTLLAAVFFCFLCAAVLHTAFALSSVLSWLSGAFILFGYIIHLVLDELYSVDMVGVRLKKSFGTALKPISFGSLKASTALFAATSGLYFFVPELASFIHEVGDVKLADALRNGLLPRNGWFGF